MLIKPPLAASPQATTVPSLFSAAKAYSLRVSALVVDGREPGASAVLLRNTPVALLALALMVKPALLLLLRISWLPDATALTKEDVAALLLMTEAIRLATVLRTCTVVASPPVPSPLMVRSFAVT